MPPPKVSTPSSLCLAAHSYFQSTDSSTQSDKMSSTELRMRFFARVFPMNAISTVELTMDQLLQPDFVLKQTRGGKEVCTAACCFTYIGTGGFMTGAHLALCGSSKQI